MNYNVTNFGRPTLGRRVKRVNDVNSMGYNPYEQSNSVQNDVASSTTNYWQSSPSIEAIATTLSQATNDSGFSPNFTTPQGGFSVQGATYSPGHQQQSQTPIINPTMFTQPNNSVFSQPLVQDMAMQYGQQLAATGKTMLQQEVNKYVPVTSLKYYFAVDTKYVIRKLSLLFFPFTHSDWSIKYEGDGQPVQPRYEINAPDLYIPTMAYATYVLIAGLVLGMQQRFTPEHIGILASTALAWCLVELAVYAATLYVAQIHTNLRVLDLLAYGGYKFVGIVAGIIWSCLGGRLAYYACWFYCGGALAFFLVRTLKAQVLVESNIQPPYYEVSPVAAAATHHSGAIPGSKRRLYFLLFVACLQPVLSWWLSYHLIGYTVFGGSNAAVDVK